MDRKDRMSVPAKPEGKVSLAPSKQAGKNLILKQYRSSGICENHNQLFYSPREMVAFKIQIPHQDLLQMWSKGKA